MITPLDERYGGAAGLDTDDVNLYTRRLTDMFFDATLRPPYDFFLPPAPNGYGWIYSNASPEWRGPWPVYDDWTLTSALLPGGSYASYAYDPTAALIRRGFAPPYKYTFQTRYGDRGSSRVMLRIMADGRKHEAAAANGGYYDIDNINTFMRIKTDPAPSLDAWKWCEQLDMRWCVFEDWPSRILDAHNLKDSVVNFNRIDGSVRDSLVFRFSSRNVQANGNRITQSGDDCIAFNAWERNFEVPSERIPHADLVYASSNILSAMQHRDPPTPPGARISANKCIGLRGDVRRANCNDNRVLPYPGEPADEDSPSAPPQPAVSVQTYAGKAPTAVRIRGLRAIRANYPVVWCDSTISSGTLQDARVGDWRGGTGCVWRVNGKWQRSGLYPAKVCEV